MLRLAVIFLIAAIIAAIFGFGGIAAGATELAKILCYVFVLVTVVVLILGLLNQ